MTTYPPGSVRALLDTPYVSEPTRAALQARLDGTDGEPRFFDRAAFATLAAICARLIPQPDRAQPIPVAIEIDGRLAKGESDGWRYDALPPDADAFRRGLSGIDQTATALFGATFTSLTAARQDEVLTAVQRGEAGGEAWQAMPAQRFFEDLLAEVAEIYFSHPLAQEEFGYVGMADNFGWQAIGLDQREPHEPRAGAASYQVPRPSASKPPVSPDAERPPSSTKRYKLDDVVDAVVIGTGAGGAPLLWRLARAGLDVVALEAGRQWQPARDWATDERAQSALFWNDERLSAGDDPLGFGRNNSGTGVGGTTLHFTGYVPRPQPDDLQLHRDWGAGVDWPLQYADLEPYWAEVERVLGVSGPSPYPWGPARPAYPLPPLPLNGAAQLMQRGCAALGMRSSPAPNAALSAPYTYPGLGRRAACTNRGFCQAGCTVGAKGSMDVTFLPLALRAGAELRSECFVTELETDSAGAISGVVYTHNGNTYRQRCRNLFLCAGAIETPRLLLLNELANSSGQVGRNFMAHVGWQVWGSFDHDVRPFKGIPGALISEDTHRPPDADFVGGYLLQSIGVMPVTYVGQRVRGENTWGMALREHMLGYNHVAGINLLGECLPYGHNRVELSQERDARGLPKPRIHFSFGANEQRMAAHAERTMRRIWSAAGAHDLWTFRRNAHTIGTCRMGGDARDSVVDADGRSWDVPNLYIADNSIFPSSLSANPALTIMALSLRIADRFLERRQA